MRKLHRYKVYGRMKINYEYEIEVFGLTENDAMLNAERQVYDKLGINVCDVVDDEIYIEKIKEITAK